MNSAYQCVEATDTARCHKTPAAGLKLRLIKAKLPRPLVISVLLVYDLKRQKADAPPRGGPTPNVGSDVDNMGI